MMMEEEVVIEEMSMKEVMVEVDDACICKEEERGGRVWGVLYAGRKMGCR